MTPRITCRELVEFLNAFLDGELDPERRSEVEEHLSACPACVAYMRSYREAVALGRRVCTAPDALVEDLPDDLARAILAYRGKDAGSGA